MALVLKGQTFKEEDEDAKWRSLAMDEQWKGFCNNELKVFEVKWTKNLEDYGKSEEDTVLEEPRKGKRVEQLEPQED